MKNVYRLALGLVCLASALPGQKGLRTIKSDEALIKTNASKERGRLYGERIDRYCGLFDGFFAPFELKRKNDNRIIVRLFATHEEFAENWRRGHRGSVPAAYFSPGLNALVLYDDPDDPWLRQTLFHEASHQYLNRYTYDAPSWFNEGLAEYFEGWWLPDEGGHEVRPALFDLIVVQEAIATERRPTLKQLLDYDRSTFRNFPDRFPQFHRYLHYSMSWSLAYYCLEGPSEEHRELWISYLQELNRRGPRARFEPEDWEVLEAEWEDFVVSLEPRRIDVDDHLLVASAYRGYGQFEEALTEYHHLLERFPEAERRCAFWMGVCAMGLGQAQQGEEFLVRCLELQPDHGRAHHQLARLLVALGDPVRYEEALEHAERAAELAPSASFRAFHAECLARVGRVAEARKRMRALVRSLDKERREPYQRRLEALLERYRK